MDCLSPTERTLHTRPACGHLAAASFWDCRAGRRGRVLDPGEEVLVGVVGCFLLERLVGPRRTLLDPTGGGMPSNQKHPVGSC